MVAKKVIWKQNKSEVLLRRDEEILPNVFRRDDENGEVFNIAKQMTTTNQDVVEEKCIRNNHGDIVFDNCANEKAWKN